MITKICDKLKCLNRHRSKSIRVTSLFFCQNDVLIRGSFWQKNSLVTLILFDLSLFKHFSLSQIFVISLLLYLCNLGDFYVFFKQLITDQITQLPSFQKEMKGQIGNFITNVTLFFSPTTSCLTFFGIIYHHVLN